jgi:hypothetical protein
MRLTLRLALTLLALTAAYYVLCGAVIERLPFASVPTWWSSLWPSRSSAVLSWFDVLDMLGALIAGLPVAAALIIFVKHNRYQTALVIATSVALFSVIRALIEFPPRESMLGVWWLNVILLFLSLAGAPLVLLWICGRLPSNMRWSGP